MFLLHVRAEPFPQHCHSLDLGCTNDSVLNVSIDMTECILISSSLLSSITVFLWGCLRTSLSLHQEASSTWFVVVSFPGSQVPLHSTYHLHFLGLCGCLLDGCLRITCSTLHKFFVPGASTQSLLLFVTYDSCVHWEQYSGAFSVWDSSYLWCWGFVCVVFVVDWSQSTN